jgi:hypothetical protein
VAKRTGTKKATVAVARKLAVMVILHRMLRGGRASLSGRGFGHRVGIVAAPLHPERVTAYLTSRGRSFRHHHAAAHTDRGENHDPAGVPIVAAQETAAGLISTLTIREQCHEC